MEGLNYSASTKVDKKTDRLINEVAKKERRSRSNVIRLLIEGGLRARDDYSTISAEVDHALTERPLSNAK